MSQLRDIGDRLRATIAIIAVWALMFSVSASGAAAVESGVSFQNSASGGLFACFKQHMTQRADAVGEKAPDSQHAGKHHCPMCLAAHTATAVLPDRISSPSEFLQASVSRVSPPAQATREPEGLALRSAHGARAPPSSI